VLGEAGEAQKAMVPMRLHQDDADEMLERECAEKGLSVAGLQAGSRNRENSAIRRGFARKFVNVWGFFHADAGDIKGRRQYAGASMTGGKIKVR
jgi:hypothetical protein